MTNQELYKQAILDAKAVRETAMAAAKESLAEAFAPRIQEMLRLKLAEELEETTELEEGDDTMEEATDKMEEAKDKMEEADDKMEEATDLEESTLDEILAELDALSEKEKMEEKKGKDEEETIKEADEDSEEEEEEESEEVDTDEDMPADMPAGPVSDDEEVVELTVGQLKDIFHDVMAQLQGGSEEMPAMGGEETLDASSEMSLEEILASLEEDEQKMEEAAYVPGDAASVAKGKVGETAEMEKLKEELKQATKAINTMRAELQEVNLLNAKLLYVNKLWKAKSLNESQKINVLNAFDRATTVKEAENIYKTLSESLTVSKKGTLKESMSFASKAVGSAPAKPIVEVDSMVARWQQIAGIK